MTSLLRLGHETLQVTPLTHNVMLSMYSFFLIIENKFAYYKIRIRGGSSNMTSLLPLGDETLSVTSPKPQRDVIYGQLLPNLVV